MCLCTFTYRGSFVLLSRLCVLWGVRTPLYLCLTCPLPFSFSFWCLVSVSVCAVSPLGVLCLCDCLWGSSAYLWPVQWRLSAVSEIPNWDNNKVTGLCRGACAGNALAAGASLDETNCHLVRKGTPKACHTLLPV